MESVISNINGSQSKESLRRFGEKIKYTYIKCLFDYLKSVNPLCQELQLIGKEIVSTMDEPGNIDEPIKLTASIQNGEGFMEVAVFTTDNLIGSKKYTFSMQGQHHYLNINNCKVESLMFPLFFTHNEDGWRHQNRKQLSFLKYLAARILQPERGWTTTIDGITQPLNRFMVMARLLQHYILESVARLQDSQLNWQRNNQSTIFGKSSNHADSNDDNANNEYLQHMNDDDLDIHQEEFDHHTEDPERVVNSNSNPTFLAGSFTGSPRHLKAMALNSLAVVSQHGQPTVFITLTVNPKWPEIVERLLLNKLNTLVVVSKYIECT